MSRKTQFVGAFGVVAGGEFDRVAGVAQTDEVDPLDDAPAGHIEARDDASDPHRCSTLKASATVNRPSYNALPVMMPAIPARRRAGDSPPDDDDSPAGDHRRGRVRRGSGETLDVGAAEHAIAGDVGDDERTRRRIPAKASSSDTPAPSVHPCTATSPSR